MIVASRIDIGHEKILLSREIRDPKSILDGIKQKSVDSN
jgi:hypothetical protein